MSPPFLAVSIERDLCRLSGADYHRWMSPNVSVHMLPALMPEGCLEGSVAVIIDILRASTTIVHALAHGATSVIPCALVEEARTAASQYERGHILLGGERSGQLIEGFDLDNSPLAYTPEVVSGRTIAFTTTNGTRALRACEQAGRVLIGAFVNKSALLRVLQEDGRPVHLVCAGTDGHLTAEDILFAGAIAAELNPQSPDVQTQMAIDYDRSHSKDDQTFRETIRTSRGGQNLLRLGLDADVARASESDLFGIVPEWSRETNMITIKN
ncbi:MAG: 2-phosphosulfolactate phosphatase [Planctomycetaceae bacterium]